MIVFHNPAQCDDASRYNRKDPVLVLRGSLKPRPRQVSAHQGNRLPGMEKTENKNLFGDKHSVDDL